MLKLIFFLCVLVFPVVLTGQTAVLSNQFHSLSINPAFAGSENALSASINYRNQWAGFEDAPKNSQLAVHSPLKSGRVGIGLQFENRSIGIYKTTDVIGNYAYRIDFKDGILAFGLGLGFTVHSVKWNNLQSIDHNDLLLPDNSSSAVMPVFSFGTYYYTKNYYVGISLPSFLSYVENSDGDYRPKNEMAAYSYLVNGGFDVDLNSDITLRPTGLIEFKAQYSTRFYFNSMLGFREKIWVGVGYRSQNTFMGMFQCQLNYQLRMAYTYDFANSDLAKYLNGSHEIGLNYIFRYSREMLSPRSF